MLAICINLSHHFFFFFFFLSPFFFSPPRWLTLIPDDLDLLHRYFCSNARIPAKDERYRLPVKPSTTQTPSPTPADTGGHSTSPSVGVSGSARKPSTTPVAVAPIGMGDASTHQAHSKNAALACTALARTSADAPLVPGCSEGDSDSASASAQSLFSHASAAGTTTML